MRGTIVLAFVLAACGEKMTPERCVSVISRVSACMDPSVVDIPAEGAPGNEVLDDGMADLCTDDDMMRFASQADACLRTTSTCAQFHACFKGPSLGDVIPKRR